ncbi:unnamed protein product [Effrenium voratum]|nr:unnamed protein product [Effrenium voratum]
MCGAPRMQCVGLGTAALALALANAAIPCVNSAGPSRPSPGVPRRPSRPSPSARELNMPMSFAHEHMCIKCRRAYVHYHRWRNPQHRQFQFQCPWEDCVWYYLKGETVEQRSNPTRSVTDNEPPEETVALQFAKSQNETAHGEDLHDMEYLRKVSFTRVSQTQRTRNARLRRTREAP